MLFMRWISRITDPYFQYCFRIYWLGCFCPQAFFSNTVLDSLPSTSFIWTLLSQLNIWRPLKLCNGLCLWCLWDHSCVRLPRLPLITLNIDTTPNHISNGWFLWRNRALYINLPSSVVCLLTRGNAWVCVGVCPWMVVGGREVYCECVWGLCWYIKLKFTSINTDRCECMLGDGGGKYAYILLHNTTTFLCMKNCMYTGILSFLIVHGIKTYLLLMWYWL